MSSGNGQTRWEPAWSRFDSKERGIFLASCHEFLFGMGHYLRASIAPWRRVELLSNGDAALALFRLRNQKLPDLPPSVSDILHSTDTYHFLPFRYLFVEFETPEEATNAVKQGDGYRLDKAHVLSVMHFKDVEKFANMSEEYKEPAEEPFVAKEHLKSWLLDPRGRDQFAVMRGEETAIFWNSKPEEELIYTRAVRCCCGLGVRKY